MLFEAKQQIANLGYPQIIVSLFNEKYGKNAFIIARWYKEHSTQYEANKEDKDWWRKVRRYGAKPTVVERVDVYEAGRKLLIGSISFDEYSKIRDRSSIAPVKSEEDVNLWREKGYIEEEFWDELFFKTNLIRAIESGIIKNIKPYSSLPFTSANEKYEEKVVFQDKKPVKLYQNGWKWVDAGDKCSIIGKQMSNCGSTGVMSMDKDRTMMVLVDAENKPHVVTTYSPNDKRISGIEGAGSTAPKDKYVDYVIDLANVLGAWLDANDNRSKFLKMKALFKSAEVSRIPSNSIDKEFFLLRMPNGKNYYSDTYETFPVEYFNQLMFPPDFLGNQPETLVEKLQMLFNYLATDKLSAINPGMMEKKKRISTANPEQTLALESLKRFIQETARGFLRNSKR